MTESKRPPGGPETSSPHNNPPPDPVRPYGSSIPADIVPASASTLPDDELTSSIQASVTEIAVMWILHWAQTRQAPAEPLDQQIANFSPRAFDVITTRFSILKRARREHLWMIYFKGLLAAGTHPHDDMIKAIKTVGTRGRIRKSTPLSVIPVATSAKPHAESPSSGSDTEADVLDQIGKALKME